MLLIICSQLQSNSPTVENVCINAKKSYRNIILAITIPTISVIIIGVISFLIYKKRTTVTTETLISHRFKISLENDPDSLTNEKILTIRLMQDFSAPAHEVNIEIKIRKNLSQDLRMVDHNIWLLIINEEKYNAYFQLFNESLMKIINANNFNLLFNKKCGGLYLKQPEEKQYTQRELNQFVIDLFENNEDTKNIINLWNQYSKNFKTS